MSNRQWVDALISRCQALAGRLCETSASALLPDVSRLVDDLPSSISRAEQLLVTDVLGRFLARFVQLAGIDEQTDVAHGFVELAAAGPTLDAWCAQWLHVSEYCAALFTDRRKTPRGRYDPRIAHMMRRVQVHYSDPALNVREIAESVKLSPSHAGRRLKQQTGFGFVAHLHRRRVAAARRLLVETAFSIKEIAAAVGYAHPSQFSRRFKRDCGVTPFAFRATQITARHPA